MKCKRLANYRSNFMLFSYLENLVIYYNRHLPPILLFSLTVCCMLFLQVYTNHGLVEQHILAPFSSLSTPSVTLQSTAIQVTNKEHLFESAVNFSSSHFTAMMTFPPKVGKRRSSDIPMPTARTKCKQVTSHLSHIKAGLLHCDSLVITSAKGRVDSCSSCLPSCNRSGYIQSVPSSKASCIGSVKSYVTDVEPVVSIKHCAKMLSDHVAGDVIGVSGSYRHVSSFAKSGFAQCISGPHGGGTSGVSRCHSGLCIDDVTENMSTLSSRRDKADCTVKHDDRRYPPSNLPLSTSSVHSSPSILTTIISFCTVPSMTICPPVMSTAFNPALSACMPILSGFLRTSTQQETSSMMMFPGEAKFTNNISHTSHHPAQIVNDQACRIDSTLNSAVSLHGDVSVVRNNAGYHQANPFLFGIATSKKPASECQIYLTDFAEQLSHSNSGIDYSAEKQVTHEMRRPLDDMPEKTSRLSEKTECVNFCKLGGTRIQENTESRV